jgi:hypothetical protein
LAAGQQEQAEKTAEGVEQFHVFRGMVRVAEQLRSKNEGTHIAMIELPPYGPSVLAAIPLCHHGRLRDSKDWLITRPAEIRVISGQGYHR